ncbi:LysR family transcriptional regulator [Sulfitobacter guttiformis]|uniref:DNA-binding transcriptional LysR family regulator n=1 Tax=Sulfitobacter guttiformis TaxID=74349 RepID=A0A420DJH5_9RHOB|nr:LysR family transcriptional regulator [Sulfitobacter guttiformis]KIN71827.1 Transcriptional regulator, LysR family protein [Sulfitobacter guttiformis KCTC 32187]RKE94358.1 DNA-binding transcriptional LysR family regulator [Sulfitobacter guttiformis]
MLNANWLNTFTTLCETGHFTRTAERLNMTQPGVSQHLRKLELQLGKNLISQQGKSFTLTAAGEAVFALGLSRRSEEEGLREVIETDDRDKGEVRIACSGSFAMLLYPSLFPWMTSAPDLSVQLEAAPQADILAGLTDGRFDLGVLAADPTHPRLEARHLGHEELCLVMPAGAPEEVTAFAELDARGFIAHPDGYAYADDLLNLNFPDAYPGGDKMRVRGYVNQIGQIPASVAQGIGYTLLPRSGVDSFGEIDRLKVVPLPERRWQELWLAHRRGRSLSARLTYASSLIIQTAARLK